MPSNAGSGGAERTPRWVTTLRAAIKQEHGFGWGIRDKGGKVQLTHRFEDGTRSSITLDCSWNPEATSEVLGLLPEIRSRMQSQRLGLAEAYALLRGPNRSKADRLDWKLMVSRFQKHKVSDTGAVKSRTWDSMYAPTMGQVLEAMVARPVPRDGRALLASLRDRCGGEPGSRGRQLRMQYASQLLRYSVRELGASERWLPPDDLSPFVGQASQEVERQGATPIKDPQLLRLLEGIPDPRWQLAVGLMACFGLRPVACVPRRLCRTPRRAGGQPLRCRRVLFGGCNGCTTKLRKTPHRFVASAGLERLAGCCSGLARPMLWCGYCRAGAAADGDQSDGEGQQNPAQAGRWSRDRHHGLQATPAP